jgi:hypothetical protein
MRGVTDRRRPAKDRCERETGIFRMPCPRHSRLSAGRSISSNSARRLVPRCRATRSLSCVTSSRIAAFELDQGEEAPIAQLAMALRPVGLCSAILRCDKRRRVQKPLQRLIAQILGQRPTQAGPPRTPAA